MTTKHLVTSAAVIATLAFAPSAFAQNRGGGRSSGGGRPSGSSRESGRAAPRSSPAPRVAPSGPRSYAPSSPRSYGGYRSYEQSRSYRGPGIVGRAVPRTYSYSYRAPRVYGPRYESPYRFYRPYYTFRPRFSIGFGLWVGYPVVYPSYAYPYAYDYYADPYYYDAPYSYPPAYGYSAPGYSAPGYSTAPYSTPVPGSVEAQRGAASGGVSFEITPSNAEVFVDGNDFGPVSEFAPTSAPLSLAPGRHHVEIRAPGYETMVFDTDVVAGQVIPYQGTMRTLR